MKHLNTRTVTQLSCGQNFVIALGQTLESTGTQELLPLASQAATEAPPERDTVMNISGSRDRGNWSRSAHREESFRTQ